MLYHVTYIVNDLEGQNEKREVKVYQHHQGNVLKFWNIVFIHSVSNYILNTYLYARYYATCSINEI